MTIPAHEGCGDIVGIPSEKEQESSKKSSKKSSMILELMQENPSISFQTMAETMDMSMAGVRRIVDKLRAQGKVRRIGPDKGGYWQTENASVE